MDPHIDPNAITDPLTRRMVEVAAAEFDGASNDGTARAVVRGDLVVERVEVGATASTPGVVGQRLAEALNAALESARAGTRASFLAMPGLDPVLRDALAGDSQLFAEDLDSDVDPADLQRDFSGTDGEVLVTVNGRSQLVVGVHLPELCDATLDSVPRAANRALAAAQLGQEGATPLDEQVDHMLASLDEKMSAIESRLDGVDDTLDALAKDLGL